MAIGKKTAAASISEASLARSGPTEAWILRAGRPFGAFLALCEQGRAGQGVMLAATVQQGRAMVTLLRTTAKGIGLNELADEL